MIQTLIHKVGLFQFLPLEKELFFHDILYSNSVFPARVEKLLLRSNLLLHSERSDSYTFDLTVEFLPTAVLRNCFFVILHLLVYYALLTAYYDALCSIFLKKFIEIR